MSENPTVTPIGIDHAGVVVSNMDRSIAFYATMLGATVHIRLDGLAGPQLSDMYGTDDVSFSLAILGIGSGSVELLQFERPAGRGTTIPRPTDLGSGHFAVQVADVEGAIAALRDAGAETVGPVIHIEEGPAAGMVLAYAHDPDGNRFELVQLP